MGCDIHSVAHVKKGDKWVYVKAEIGGDDRSYNAFAVLANVRNEYDWPPICEPRGLPIDVASKIEGDDYYPYLETKRELEEGIWMGDHSFSWLTLKEIKDYLANSLPGINRAHGYVSRDVYQRIKSGEIDRPDSWCGGVWAPGKVIIHENEIKDTPEFDYVYMEWDRPSEICLPSLFDIVKELEEIAQKHSVQDDEVRYTFGFDN